MVQSPQILYNIRDYNRMLNALFRFLDPLYNERDFTPSNTALAILAENFDIDLNLSRTTVILQIERTISIMNKKHSLEDIVFYGALTKKEWQNPDQVINILYFRLLDHSYDILNEATKLPNIPNKTESINLTEHQLRLKLREQAIPKEVENYFIDEYKNEASSKQTQQSKPKKPATTIKTQQQQMKDFISSSVPTVVKKEFLYVPLHKRIQEENKHPQMPKVFKSVDRESLKEFAKNVNVIPKNATLNGSDIMWKIRLPRLNTQYIRVFQEKLRYYIQQNIVKNFKMYEPDFVYIAFMNTPLATVNYSGNNVDFDKMKTNVVKLNLFDKHGNDKIKLGTFGIEKKYKKIVDSTKTGNKELNKIKREIASPNKFKSEEELENEVAITADGDIYESLTVIGIDSDVDLHYVGYPSLDVTFVHGREIFQGGSHFTITKNPKAIIPVKELQDKNKKLKRNHIKKQNVSISLEHSGVKVDLVGVDFITKSSCAYRSVEYLFNSDTAKKYGFKLNKITPLSQFTKLCADLPVQVISEELTTLEGDPMAPNFILYRAPEDSESPGHYLPVFQKPMQEPVKKKSKTSTTQPKKSTADYYKQIIQQLKLSKPEQSQQSTEQDPRDTDDAPIFDDTEDPRDTDPEPEQEIYGPYKSKFEDDICRCTKKTPELENIVSKMNKFMTPTAIEKVIELARKKSKSKVLTNLALVFFDFETLHDHAILDPYALCFKILFNGFTINNKSETDYDFHWGFDSAKYILDKVEQLSIMYSNAMKLANEPGAENKDQVQFERFSKLEIYFIGFNNNRFDDFILLHEAEKNPKYNIFSRIAKNSIVKFSITSFGLPIVTNTLDMLRVVPGGSLSKLCKDFCIPEDKSKKSFDHIAIQAEFEHHLTSQETVAQWFKFCRESNQSPILTSSQFEEFARTYSLEQLEKKYREEMSVYNKFDIVSLIEIYNKFDKECIPDQVDNPEQHYLIRHHLRTAGSLAMYNKNRICGKPKMFVSSFKLFKEIRSAICAGRSENMEQGKFENQASLDVTSLYPTAMNDVTYFPSGKFHLVYPIGYETSVDTTTPIKNPDYKPGYHHPFMRFMQGFLQAEFTQTPDKLIYNIIARRSEHEPLDWKSSKPISSLIDTQTYYLLITHGIQVKVTKHIYWQSEKTSYFAPYINKLFKLKQLQDELKEQKSPLYSEAKRTSSKLGMNSVYGKSLENIHYDTMMFKKVADNPKKKFNTTTHPDPYMYSQLESIETSDNTTKLVCAKLLDDYISANWESRYNKKYSLLGMFVLANARLYMYELQEAIQKFYPADPLHHKVIKQMDTDSMHVPQHIARLFFKQYPWLEAGKPRDNDNSKIKKLGQLENELNYSDNTEFAIAPKVYAVFPKDKTIAPKIKYKGVNTYRGLWRPLTQEEREFITANTNSNGELTRQFKPEYEMSHYKWQQICPVQSTQIINNEKKIVYDSSSAEAMYTTLLNDKMFVYGCQQITRKPYAEDINGTSRFFTLMSTEVQKLQKLKQ